MKTQIRSSMFRGAYAAFRAFGIIRRYRLIRYVIIPFFINIAVLTASAVAAYLCVYEPILRVVKGPSWYHKVFEFLVAPVLIIALGLLVVVTYSLVGSAAAAPFCDILSEKVETSISGVRFDSPFRLTALIRSVARGIGTSIKLAVLYIAVHILLLLLNIIPIAGNAIYAAAGFLATSFLLGVQFFDYPMDRRFHPFREKMRICWRFKGSVAGVGAAFAAMTFVPIVGFLGIAIATVAATTVFSEDIAPFLPKGSS